MRRYAMFAIGSLAFLSGAALFVLVGRGYSAREQPSTIEALLARRLRHLATPRDALEQSNPLQASSLALAEARDHFADHCAICHANDGSGKTMINGGLYPPAPDLRAHETQALSDGEMFYVIKNGIRFTGMPGWGGEDLENWQLVLFIRHLPELGPEERELMEELNGLRMAESGP